jgi:hypothetical protein
MRKFKLSVEDLEVESFTVLPDADGRIGTVKGHAAATRTLVYTDCGDPGCPAHSGTQCVTCDPSYCDTACPSCGPQCTHQVSCDPSYCDTACPGCWSIIVE